MILDDLDTPCLIVDRDRLGRNLARMQETADLNGVALRPHVKTHKSVAMARQQAEQGARGLTVAKVDEAEVFVEAGFEDVRIAYPVVGAAKHERVYALMDRARISFCVDTLEGAGQASDFYASRDADVEVLMEVDVGHGRCGVPWDSEDAITLARRMADLPGLRLAGLLTHAGQAYRGPRDDETPEAALRRVATEERDRMLDVAARLHAADVLGATPGALTLSIGSTPSMRYFENRTHEGFRITEIRPGNYVFYDAMQVALRAAALDDCALTVYTSVVSKRRDRSGTERLFLDAGKKVTTSDAGYGTEGYGTVLYNAAYMRANPHAHIYNLSEEHGWLRVPGGATYDVGDRLRFVPNHACVTVNTQTRLYVVDGEDIIDVFDVDARGGVQ